MWNPKQIQHDPAPIIRESLSYCCRNFCLCELLLRGAVYTTGGGGWWRGVLEVQLPTRGTLLLVLKIRALPAISFEQGVPTGRPWRAASAGLLDGADIGEFLEC